MIDAIDGALIESLAEEIPIEELRARTLQLAKDTFAYSVGNERERQTLTNLFALRGERIRAAKAAPRFKAMSRAGTGVRAIDSVLTRVDLANEIWRREMLPFDPQWLGFIVDSLFKIPSFAAGTTDIGQRQDVAFHPDRVRAILERWIQGGTYKQIADYATVPVEALLAFFAAVINSVLLVSADTIVMGARVVAEEAHVELSAMAQRWTDHVRFGVPTGTELALFDLGFTDRSAVVDLGLLVRQTAGQLETAAELRDQFPLIPELIQQLRGRIPTLMISPQPVLNPFSTDETYVAETIGARCLGGIATVPALLPHREATKVLKHHQVPSRVLSTEVLDTSHQHPIQVRYEFVAR